MIHAIGRLAVAFVIHVGRPAALAQNFHEFPIGRIFRRAQAFHVAEIFAQMRDAALSAKVTQSVVSCKFILASLPK